MTWEEESFWCFYAKKKKIKDVKERQKKFEKEKYGLKKYSRKGKQKAH